MSSLGQRARPHAARAAKGHHSSTSACRHRPDMEAHQTVEPGALQARSPAVLAATAGSAGFAPPAVSGWAVRARFLLVFGCGLKCPGTRPPRVASAGGRVLLEQEGHAWRARRTPKESPANAGTLTGRDAHHFAHYLGVTGWTLRNAAVSEFPAKVPLGDPP